MIPASARRCALLGCLVVAAASPADAGGPLLTEDAKLTASDGAAFDVFGEVVAVSGDRLIVSARLDDDGASASGSAYVFERAAGEPTGWLEVTELHTPMPAANEWFGIGAALDGDRAVVGTQPQGGVPPPGVAHVFERDAGGPDNWGWVATLTAPQSIGAAVAIDGDRVVASKFMALAAYVFERDRGGPSNWGLAATLTPSMPGPLETYGDSVAIDGDTIVVGSPTLHTDPGHAYVYLRDPGTGLWSETARLSSSGEVGRSKYGRAVAIEGDTVAVGSPTEWDTDPLNGHGVAYVYERDQGGPGAWGEVARLVPSDPEFEKGFGQILALDGTSLIVGASRESNDIGSAYWYSSAIGSWLEAAKLVASDRAGHDFFGQGVGLAGDTAAVGAKFDDDLGTNSGSAYVYELSDFFVFFDGFESGDTSAWSETLPFIDG